MEISELLPLLHTIEQLKNTTRHSWTSAGRHESVAEHSWRLALMTYFVRDEFPQANGERLLLLSLTHDLGEIFTGDIRRSSKPTRTGIRNSSVWKPG